MQRTIFCCTKTQFSDPRSSKYLFTIYVAEIILADRTAAHTIVGCWHDTVVCLSVCLSVTKYIVTQ